MLVVVVVKQMLLVGKLAAAVEAFVDLELECIEPW